ncbi:hypothetical protein C8F04DRAFT_1175220 [Mycena alexandri]|uniref:Uncharacterized protein n=1 Tax=Mycena alexandri TaxID=1745969 RepID=A0AAD6TCV6_9AGAR|nr:hypothetical protein C8F04DRAFT_1175220 [Mycena alexandri]
MGAETATPREANSEDDGGDGAGRQESGEEEGGDSDGSGGGEDESMLHEVWRQSGDTTVDWSPECRKAFGAFIAGKDELGVEWGDCVRAWLDVEKASGFDNDGGQLTTEKRPKEVKDFIKNGRKWYVPVKLGEARLGCKDLEKSYIAQWWEWWSEIQGTAGEEYAGLATMHGRTGFMIVLLTLLWWGTVDHGDEWEEAVAVTTKLLRDLLAMGKIKQKQRPVAKVGEKRKRGKGDEGEEYEEEDEHESEMENEGEKAPRGKHQNRSGGKAKKRTTRSAAATSRN